MRQVQQRIFPPRSREVLAYLASLFPQRATELEMLMNSRGVNLVVSPLKKRRSLDQNALYWAQLQILADELGMSKDEAHYAVKAKLLGSRDTRLGPVPNSSADLDVFAFTDFLDQMQAVAVDMGIRLPVTPEEFEAYEASRSA